MVASSQIDALLEQLAATLQAERRLPEATYRLQFNAGFTFQDAARIVPYLHELGISDCYASPYLKCRPGSGHGYDVVDHHVLNPEIGTEEDYEVYIHALRAHGLGQVFDVVPNHMGIVGNANAWWNDVLENGPSSPYANFFDIDWHPVKPALHNKVLLPVLGNPYGQVLEAGQLTLSYEAGTLDVHYFDHRFPVAPGSALKIVRLRLDELEENLGAESADLMEFHSIVTAISHLPGRTETDPAKVAERQREKEVIRRRLAILVDSCESVRRFIDENLAIINGRVGAPHSFDLLDNLLNDQAYRLSFWRVASDEINYRRFFDVNELAALSMERREVFTATHELILRLLRESKITGLRIDHPDGLYDPRQYLERLQCYYALERARRLFAENPEYEDHDWIDWEAPLLEAIVRVQADAASPLHKALYVVVEKILSKDEPLPEDWPVHGTTGYEFLNTLNGLFINSAHAGTFGRIYQRRTGQTVSFKDIVYQKKFLILQVSLSSELHMLAHQLDRLSEENRWSRDFTLNSLRHALRDIIACFPVYRSYIADGVIQPRDQLYIETAVFLAKRKNPAISASLFEFVRDMLLLKYPDTASPADREEQQRFVGKFQQVTGPVMAKGLEDSAFYVYNRFLSVNEVGGDADRFGVPPPAFHAHNQQRQAYLPWSLSATSTHDTKRSEDVRARLNVLSELPNDWRSAVRRWFTWNEPHRVKLEAVVAPDPNDEYFLYQTLVGAWPLEPYSPEEYAVFVARIQEYMQKAIHEAKVHTSWINPNSSYANAIREFVAAILDEKLSELFVEDLRTFQKQLSHFGLFNSLSQTLLKIASPGVPDTYQGTELWDFSLVDPDNRRPVNYELRRHMLQELITHANQAGKELPQFARELVQAKEDGRVKLYVTYRALHCRREHPGLFSVGDYIPAEILGSKHEHVCAFIRRQESDWAVAAVPRLVAGLVRREHELPLGKLIWEDGLLVLPGFNPGRRLENVFTGEILVTSGWRGKATLNLVDLFANFPVALLTAQGSDKIVVSG
jgi:(1->4)-alpha-D-glucan 1-alpha-D-glucosylmutase